MGNQPFQFKQFSVQQDQCAMKIGTDGVLLGAWTSIAHQPKTILDIGTGTGIIALQLAQRSNAELIDALEINGDAYEQGVENFENSPWADRLFCYHASLEEFADETEEPYDLIVSNPPFYNDNYYSEDPSRHIARSTSSLSFASLLKSVSHLLSEEGVFAAIVPHKEEKEFIELAKKYELFPKRICRVKGHPSSEIKRSLLEFSFKHVLPENSMLTLEIARHQYTNDYKELVKDFYIHL